MLSPRILCLAFIGLTQAASLFERAPAPAPVSCDDVTSAVAGTQNGAALAGAFCRQQLAIVPKYTTVFNTKTKTITKTSAGTTVLTATNSALGTKTKTVTTATTTRVVVTPATVTVTDTVTSTAYVDSDGNTLSIMKRSEPTELAKRALPTPVFFKQYKSHAQIVQACQCLNLQPVTYTRTGVVTATSTKNVGKTYTKVVTSTIPVSWTTQVVTNVIPLTVQAPAPVVTVSAVEIDDVLSCPPTEDTTWICPDGTGDDDGSLSSTNQLNCAVQANDGFYGDCVYWNDDGSPYGSTLTYEDPDTGDVSTRDATYGNDDTDDCPAWSDYTCSVPDTMAAGSKRSMDDFVAIDGTSLLMERAAHHKKKKMPKGLRRGGRYHPSH